eukprot:TCALIF_02587-PA protein Name:"Protein of unknown function" AED:0.51 eAED:0.79 QI:141/0.6/0.5/0.83/0.2/0.16/6/0/1239
MNEPSGSKVPSIQERLQKDTLQETEGLIDNNNNTETGNTDDEVNRDHFHEDLSREYKPKDMIIDEEKTKGAYDEKLISDSPLTSTLREGLDTNHTEDDENQCLDTNAKKTFETSKATPATDLFDQNSIKTKTFAPTDITEESLSTKFNTASNIMDNNNQPPKTDKSPATSPIIHQITVTESLETTRVSMSDNLPDQSENVPAGFSAPDSTIATNDLPAQAIEDAYDKATSTKAILDSENNTESTMMQLKRDALDGHKFSAPPPIIIPDSIVNKALEAGAASASHDLTDQVREEAYAKANSTKVDLDAQNNTESTMMDLNGDALDGDKFSPPSPIIVPDAIINKALDKGAESAANDLPNQAREEAYAATNSTIAILDSQNNTKSTIIDLNTDAFDGDKSTAPSPIIVPDAIVNKALEAGAASASHDLPDQVIEEAHAKDSSLNAILDLQNNTESNGDKFSAPSPIIVPDVIVNKALDAGAASATNDLPVLATEEAYTAANSTWVILDSQNNTKSTVMELNSDALDGDKFSVPSPIIVPDAIVNKALESGAASASNDLPDQVIQEAHAKASSTNAILDSQKNMESTIIDLNTDTLDGDMFSAPSPIIVPDAIVNKALEAGTASAANDLPNQAIEEAFTATNSSMAILDSQNNTKSTVMELNSDALDGDKFSAPSPIIVPDAIVHKALEAGAASASHVLPDQVIEEPYVAANSSNAILDSQNHTESTIIDLNNDAPDGDKFSAPSPIIVPDAIVNKALEAGAASASNDLPDEVIQEANAKDSSPNAILDSQKNMESTIIDLNTDALDGNKFTAPSPIIVPDAIVNKALEAGAASASHDLPDQNHTESTIIDLNNDAPDGDKFSAPSPIIVPDAIVNKALEAGAASASNDLPDEVIQEANAKDSSLNAILDSQKNMESTIIDLNTDAFDGNKFTAPSPIIVPDAIVNKALEAGAASASHDLPDQIIEKAYAKDSSQNAILDSQNNTDSTIIDLNNDAPDGDKFSAPSPIIVPDVIVNKALDAGAASDPNDLPVLATEEVYTATNSTWVILDSQNNTKSTVMELNSGALDGDKFSAPSPIIVPDAIVNKALESGAASASNDLPDQVIQEAHAKASSTNAILDSQKNMESTIIDLNTDTLDGDMFSAPSPIIVPDAIVNKALEAGTASAANDLPNQAIEEAFTATNSSMAILDSQNNTKSTVMELNSDALDGDKFSAPSPIIVPDAIVHKALEAEQHQINYDGVE